MQQLIRSLVHRRAAAGTEDGQTMVEYGLILALLAVVTIAILGTIGAELVAIFTSVAGAF